MVKAIVHHLVAHRGDRKYYPENSLLAMKKAVDAGALYLETDIQFSRDKQPVLYHDLSMRRLSGLDITVNEQSLAQLKLMPVREAERLSNDFQQTICSLAQFVLYLQQHSNVTVFIELKEQSIAWLGVDQVLEQVCALLLPIRARAVIISFDVSIIAAARQRGWPQVGVVLRRWQQRNEADITTIAPEYIFADNANIPKNDALHLANGKLVIYELDDPKKATALLQRGADMIETFAISDMIGSLA